jgi:hypothetical protein
MTEWESCPHAYATDIKSIIHEKEVSRVRIKSSYFLYGVETMEISNGVAKEYRCLKVRIERKVEIPIPSIDGYIREKFAAVNDKDIDPKG